MYNFVAFKDENSLYFFDLNSSTRFVVTKEDEDGEDGEDGGFECTLSSYEPSMEFDYNIESKFKQKHFEAGTNIKDVMNTFDFYERNWSTNPDNFELAIVEFLS